MISPANAEIGYYQMRLVMINNHVADFAFGLLFNPWFIGNYIIKLLK